MVEEQLRGGTAGGIQVWICVQILKRYKLAHRGNGPRFHMIRMVLGCGRSALSRKEEVEAL